MKQKAPKSAFLLR